MWRRRREKARARAVRTDAGASGGAVTGAPRVALTPPAEFSRRTTQDQPADMVPAPAGWPANGRLGRNMASVYCIRCGQENPEGARFCSQCGNLLARGSAEGASETTSII